MNWYQTKMNWYKTAQQSYQKGWVDDLGDVVRYAYDNYQCRAYLTKTFKRITVAVSINHNYFGHLMWSDFWEFPLTAESEARSTFNKVKEATSAIFDDFRTNEIPNPMLHSYLREACRKIDPEFKPTTRIPSVDWAKAHDGVKDWRNSIYGTRYPMTSDGY